MNYQVPEEYRNFVSNAKEVLEQFEFIAESDRLVFRIFDIDNIFCSSTTYKEAIERYFDLLETVQSVLNENIRIQKYIWFREYPELRLNICTNSKVCQPTNVFIEGSLRVGDCVDDEWFLVKELMSLSIDFPSICASIVDSDGQFLLIEAADCIPEWLTPLNADNRIWIRRGLANIIPLNAEGRLPNDSISLDQALRYLLDESCIERRKFGLDFEPFQGCITRRIQKLSPAYVKACKHLCVCYLPVELIALIDNIDSIIGSIVDELGKPNLSSHTKSSGGKGQCEKRSTKVNFWDLILPRGQSDKIGNRCIGILFTRAQFAKMIFKPFRAPAMLQEYQKNAFAALMESCGEDPKMKQRAQKNAEVSCRLLVGVALLLRKHFEDVDRTEEEVQETSTIETFLREIFGELGSPMKNFLESGKFLERSSTIEAMTIDGYFTTDNEEVPLSHDGAPEYGVKRDIGRGRCYEEATRKKVSDFLYEARNITHNQQNISLSVTDDDSWITLSEEAFDLEMIRRVENFESNETGGVIDRDRVEDGGKASSASEMFGKPFNQDDNKHMHDMERIVSGMKHLMEASSDSEEGDRYPDTSIIDETTDEIDVPLHVDVDKVLEIVNTYKNGSIGDNRNADDEGLWVSVDDYATQDEETLSYEEYSNAMEEELSGSAMAQTFERTMPSKESPAGTVDMERNLLQNLMEAEAVHPGARSPATTLLSLIGAKLPSVDSDAHESFIGK